MTENFGLKHAKFTNYEVSQSMRPIFNLGGIPARGVQFVMILPFLLFDRQQFPQR
jgi:hypothetical protein